MNTPPTGFNNTAPDNFNGLGGGFELPNVNIGNILRSYFQIILKYWWIILLTFVLLMTLATLWAKRIVPEYRATTTIEIKQEDTNILGNNSVSQVDANEEFLLTQISLLKSTKLAKTVAEDLNFLNNPKYIEQTGSREQKLDKASKIVQNKLTITRLGRSRIIAISVEDTNPKMAANIANTLAENFARYDQERKFNSTAFARDFVRDRLNATRAILEESEKELFDYTQQAGILGGVTSNGNRQNDLNDSALRTLNTELISARTKRIEAQNIYEQAQETDLLIELQNNTSLNELKQLKTRLDIDYQKNLQTLGPKHPEMLAIQAQIDVISNQVSSTKNDVLGTLEINYQNALKLEQQYEGRINGLRSQMITTQSADFNYTLLKREVETNRAQYDALLQRFKEITVSDGTGADLISIVDEALVPKNPFKPNLTIIIALAGLLSLLVSTGAVILANALDDLIKTPEDIQTKLHLTSIGAIPIITSENKFSDELRDPLSHVSEGYASVRSFLNLYHRTDENTALQVTSTRPSEGKSSSAFALAKSYAEAGQSVLLIDADLRKPGFNYKQHSIGLSGLIESPEDLMRSTIEPEQHDIPNLRLLPSGAIPDNPVALLSNMRFRAIIEEAKEKFDFVVVDSPPVLGLADAVIIGAICNGTILAIEHNSLRRPQVLNSIKRLRTGGANILGAIMTKYKINFDNYSGDSYYYYYSYKNDASSQTSKKRGLGSSEKHTKKEKIEF